MYVYVYIYIYIYIYIYKLGSLLFDFISDKNVAFAMLKQEITPENYF